MVQLAAEYSTALASTPQVSYLTQDTVGSPRIITNENGAVTSRKDYTAFGEEVVSSQRVGGPTGNGYDPPNVRQDYTGYQNDEESGLEYAQARFYNSGHGRFTSVDPLTASASIKNPQTFNRYSYGLNSPYKFTDPLGLAAENNNGWKEKRRWEIFWSAVYGVEGEYDKEGSIISETQTVPKRSPSLRDLQKKSVERRVADGGRRRANELFGDFSPPPARYARPLFNSVVGYLPDEVFQDSENPSIVHRTRSYGSNFTLELQDIGDKSLWNDYKYGVVADFEAYSLSTGILDAPSNGVINLDPLSLIGVTATDDFDHFSVEHIKEGASVEYNGTFNFYGKGDFIIADIKFLANVRKENGQIVASIQITGGTLYSTPTMLWVPSK